MAHLRAKETAMFCVPILSAISPYILGCAFTIAAIGKIINLKYFYEILRVAPFIPQAPRPWLVLLVPLLELSLGCTLLLPQCRQYSLRVAFFTLVVFTAFLVFLVLHPFSPGCRCLGVIEFASKAKTQNLLGLCRNSLLLFINLLGMRLSTARPPA